MNSTPRNTAWLIVGIATLCAVGWLVNTTPPDSTFSVWMLFILITVAVYTISMFIFNRRRHAELITVGVVVLLLLRFIHLRHPLYIILLAAALLSIELTSKNDK